MLKDLQPSIFFVEETKMKRQGQIKSKNSEKYVIYELIRKGRAGGGLAIGVVKELNPTWISEGDNMTEILTVQVNAQDFAIRCVAGYGPQENDLIDKKLKFWSKLGTEVEDADNLGLGFVLQFDGNLWAGADLIPGDPNPINNNGRLFKEFLAKYPNLTVINSLSICQGLITRRRTTVKKTEQSVIDFFVVCSRVIQFVEKMQIDEDRNYSLTNYNMKKGQSRPVETDHNPLILDLNISFLKPTKQRMEIYNLKNLKCQEVFYEHTSNSTNLSECFLNSSSLKTQVENWEVNFSAAIRQCFKRIRITDNKNESKSDQLMEKRKVLRNQLKTASDDQKITEIQNDIKSVENELSSLLAGENLMKIKDNLQCLTNIDGSTAVSGVWKLTKKLFPKNSKTLPISKKNSNGRLISSPEELKDLYIETYVHRLRHRPVKPEFEELKCLKEELCSKRLELVKMKPYHPWGKDDLERVLKSLKKNKSRDPHYLINEIFKPGVIGTDLFNSLLLLFNRVKFEFDFPDIMKLANIISIYKGKGEKNSLESDRGIFIINIFRSIMMKLIYNDEYDNLDEQMSDSNIGARKNKNIRNHIFIINGVINETLKNKKKCIDIQILDYRQCFDSMWLEECINDLYESGLTNPNLALIYQANKENEVSVMTPNGLSRRESINTIVMQGEVLGPIECSVTVDTFGKECLNEEKYLYAYKGLVGIPPLAMVDDLACISSCGLETVQMNGFINAKTNIKKLQFGEKKCHKMHIGKKSEYCPDLFIDSWKVETLPETDDKVDKFIGDFQIEDSDEERYLGDLLTADGSNIKNIKARKAKGFGINDKIMTMLDEIFFGPYSIKVGLIFRCSHLINSILLNSEVWYGLTKADVDELEVVDNALLRRILEAPACTPTPMLYLELGCLPFRYIIMTRRLMYLQYLLQEEENSLLHQFFKAQADDPVKGDWFVQVKEDMDTIKLNLSLDDIKIMSKEVFKERVASAVQKAGFQFLSSEKSKMSKVMSVQHESLSLQEYFLPSFMNIQEAKMLFRIRSRMVDVKMNFKNKYSDTLCPVCKTVGINDSQEHVLECAQLLKNQNILANSDVLYVHIFESDIKKQTTALRMFNVLWDERKEILKTEKT